MKLLEGKVALITGAARGIGKAIALKYAAEGADIAFTDLVIDEIGKQTEQEIAALGVKVKGYASNAASFEETEAVVKQIHEEFGHIDILVNNAGITKDGLMLHHDAPAQWLHHQHGIGSGCSRQRRTGQLRRQQGRPHRTGQEHRPGDG